MRTLTTRALTAPLAILLVSACGSTGGLGDILGGARNAPRESTGPVTVNAEIQANDLQQQMVQIVTDDGQQGVVRWDAGTEVIYNNETYEAAALERGDLVQMRVQQTSDGQLYTDYVVVTQSVQERTGTDGANESGLVQLQGNVTAIDRDDGQFQLRTNTGATVLVTLPYNPPTATADRFRLLDDGDYVRVEGRYVTQTRLELTRFN